MSIHMDLKMNLYKENKIDKIYAPMNGEVFRIEEVLDNFFSHKEMGEGIAIAPADGKVYSPINGEVFMSYSRKHAMGLITNNGTEVRIQYGLKTEKLLGHGFTQKVSLGDKVSVGDLILEVDLEYVQSQIVNTMSPIVILNSHIGRKKINFTSETMVKAGKTVIMTVEDSKFTVV